MDILKDFIGHKLKELKNVNVKDADGEIIGRLIDAAFKLSKDKIELTKFIIGGSRIEELLERLRIKDDIDPVFDINLIDTLSLSEIKLSVPKEDLKSTHIHTDALDENEISLSKLGKMKIIDKEDNLIGNIIDLKFESDEFSFLIGDGPVIEWAESAGLLPDIDYLLFPKSISSIEDNQIRLNKRKDELKSTFKKYIADYRTQRKTQSDVRGRDIRAGSSFYFPSIQ